MSEHLQNQTHLNTAQQLFFFLILWFHFPARSCWVPGRCLPESLQIPAETQWTSWSASISNMHCFEFFNFTVLTLLVRECTVPSLGKLDCFSESTYVAKTIITFSTTTFYYQPWYTEWSHAVVLYNTAEREDKGHSVCILQTCTYTLHTSLSNCCRRCTNRSQGLDSKYYTHNMQEIMDNCGLEWNGFTWSACLYSGNNAFMWRKSRKQEMTTE